MTKCKICDNDTSPLGIDGLCDGCWEVYTRLGNVEKDAKIILDIGSEYAMRLTVELIRRQYELYRT